MRFVFRRQKPSSGGRLDVQGTSAYLRQLGLSARAASAKARLLQHCDRALDVAGASKKRWS
ncbi:MAG TPA: hypothetical protein VF178_12990, partial [Gemmatimonadaceae bacterium]